MGERLNKKEALEHWRGLPAAAPLNPRPIQYKHAGSTYGMDGIRIEGSRAFIDAVLGRLADLLEYENAATRIGLNYQRVEPREGKACAGDWVCYVKVYERGEEAKAVNRWASGMAGRPMIVSAG